MDNHETWKKIPGFIGYDISTCGRIRSHWKRIRHGWELDKNYTRLLSLALEDHGYYVVNVKRESGKRYPMRVHSLVALTFLGPCPDGLEVCHNDGDHRNNHVSNLRYDTHKSNMEDASEQIQWPNGEDHASAMLTNAQAKEIREMANKGIDFSNIAKHFGIAKYIVSGIVYGRTYKNADGPKFTLKQRRLSDLEAEELRYDRADGMSLKALSEKYGISESAVSRIALGRRHLRAGGPIQITPWDP